MYLKIDKKKVEDSFGKNATFYDDRTSLQKEILVKLNNYLFDDKIITKQQNLNLLDLGCGTGEFSKKLNQNLNLKKIHLLDLSSQMLKVAKRKINSDKIILDKQDFDRFRKFGDFDLIVSNMSLHWSSDIYKLLERILDSMRLNSIFLFTVPNNKSFSFFKDMKLRYVVNKFPETRSILKKIDKRFNFKKYEYQFDESTFSPIQFLKNLKRIGANVTNKNVDLRNLFSLRKFDHKKIKINYNINFFIIKKIKDV